MVYRAMHEIPEQGFIEKKIEWPLRARMRWEPGKVTAEGVWGGFLLRW